MRQFTKLWSTEKQGMHADSIVLLERTEKIFCAACLAVVFVLGANTPLKAQGKNNETPGVLSLSGLWKFSTDKEESGLATGYHTLEFDDTAWKQIKVPGAYNYQGFSGYLGVAWYRLKVTVPAEWEGQPVFLQLPPVDDSDETYWNGKKIGGLDSKAFTRPRLYTVPADSIKWGESNVIAVRVTNKYMGGGFTSFAPANLISVGPFTETSVNDPEEAVGEALLPLEATNNVDTKLQKSWVYGWRDAGTADTRPLMHARPGPEKDSEAIGFEIKYPNASGEFLDYNLEPREQGGVWATRDYDFIQFDYHTDDTEGEMRLYLNGGGWRWMKGDAGFGTSFPINKGGWTRVVLPFEEFHKAEPRVTTYLGDLKFIKALTLGYRNNEMQSKGEVRFANFAVGRFAGKSVERVKLDGLWHFAEDPEEKGVEKKWHLPGGDFKTWNTLATGFPWYSQGRKEYEGIVWLKQEVFIPERWEGTQLRLRLGQLTSNNDAGEIYVNGVKVGGTGTHDMKLDVAVPSSVFKAGQMNAISLKIKAGNPKVAGLMEGPFEILPQSIWVAVREQGSKEEPVISTEFDPGAIVGKSKYELSLRVPGHHLPNGTASISYQIKDCFHRVIKSGEGKLQASKGKNYLELPVVLDDEESRRLFFSETFDVKVLAKNGGNEPVYAGAQLEASMTYKKRDEFALTELPETWEETPYGKLKLVDAIDASKDPSTEGVVYKEGGHRKSWVGRRAYSTWVDGIVIREFKEKQYREANNNEWFAYRVGRGKIVPGKAYLVRIEYPEDKTRYVPINIDTSRNYQGLGFKTGVSAEDPFDDFPISGNYEFFDTVVIPDETTYGSKGSRTVSTDHGFWIFFFDNGRAYTPEFQSGPAVSRILVYEMPEGKAAHAVIRYPQDAPKRLFIADWEREPEWVAKDMVHHALISGYNGISPSILKWGKLAFWHAENLEKVQLSPVRPVREPLPPDETSALDKYLEASKAAGLTIFPRLEYGGTDALPKEARAIGPNGKPARPNRFHTWCSNLLKPQVLEEFFEILNQVVGKNIKSNPQIGGILFRIRSDRLPISYGPSDVEMYAAETGDKPPAESAGEALSKWASDPARKATYDEWWQGKRRDFHAKIVERLKGYRPDMKMLYYNWDPDRWNLGQYDKTPEDYRDYYNVNTSIEYYKHKAAFQKAVPDEEYVRMVREGDLPHHQVRPELYADVDGFALLGPVCWHYLADNPLYINSFRTGDQLALTKLFDYEEKGRWNVQGDNYESSELATGGPDFAMAEQVLSVFHGDPWILTETAYTYGSGFMDRHRQFALAFLALPAVKPEELPLSEMTGKDDLRVRRYEAVGKTYVSVTYKGYQAGQFDLKLPGKWPASVKVTDLVTGVPLEAQVNGGTLSIKLATGPMTLHSYLVEAAGQ